MQDPPKMEETLIEVEKKQNTEVSPGHLDDNGESVMELKVLNGQMKDSKLKE